MSEATVKLAVSPRQATNKRLLRLLASWSRWLHIYSSMFGLAVILFFSVTGLTLNHPDWFFSERTTQVSGQIDKSWLNTNAPPPSTWDQYDYSHQVSKMEVVEFLRGEHRLRGRVSDFLAFEDECEVTFQAPGYAATARIARATGSYTLDITANDLMTVLNDLHKGRHTGIAWSLLIDASAILGTVVGLTGFCLIFFLRLRRRWGLAAAGAGTIVMWGLYQVATS